MSLASASIERPVLTGLIFFVVVVLGIFCLSRVPVDLRPEMTYPILSVSASYQDSSPFVVEEQITIPLERALVGVPGVKNISSYSSEGYSAVVLEFNWGQDLSEAIDDVRDRLDRALPSLPDEVDRPVLRKYDVASQDIMVLGVGSSFHPLELTSVIKDDIAKRLERSPGVALAEGQGGLDREIRVEVHESTVKALGLDLTSFGAIIGRENATGAGGEMEVGRLSVAIRSQGEFTSLDQLKNLVILDKSGQGQIHLGDIATIVDGWDKVSTITRINGQNSQFIRLYKQSGANTVKTAASALEVVEDINNRRPNVDIQPIFDSSEHIKKSIGAVTESILVGGFLAVAVILVFLQHLKSALVLSLSIPISIIATFLTLYFGGLTLNVITMGALALGVGMMVDNSIVVLDNVYRLRAQGLPPKKAAAQGADELKGAVIASSLTTLSVFLPMIFLEDMTGELFRPFSFTIAFSLTCSLVVSLTLTPMMASLLLEKAPNSRSSGLTGGDDFKRSSSLSSDDDCRRSPGFTGEADCKWSSDLTSGDDFKRSPGLTGDAECQPPPSGLSRDAECQPPLSSLPEGAFSQPFPLKGDDFGQPRYGRRYFQALVSGYLNRLALALKRPWLTVILAFSLLLVSLALIPFLGTEFMGRSDGGEFSVILDMEKGTRVEETSQTMSLVEAIVDENAPEKIRAISWITGHRGVLRVKLGEFAKRERSVFEIVEDLRPKLASVPGVSLRLDVDNQASSLIDIGGSGSRIQVEIRGDDLETASRIAKTMKEILENLPGIRDVYLSHEDRSPEEVIAIDRVRAADAGVSIASVNALIRTALGGQTAGNYRERGREFPIRVVLKDAETIGLERLLNLPVVNRRGQMVVLSNVVTVKKGLAPLSISRKNQSRVQYVYASIAGRSLGSVAKDIEREFRTLPLGQDFSYALVGDLEDQAKTFRDLTKVLLLSVFLLYSVMAGQFEGFKGPLVIMFALPFAAIGVIWIHFLTNTAFNVNSFIGLVILAGIVVNNAIILVDQANALRKKEGHDLTAALLEAGKRRLRPILMTTLTTILGLVPMALGFGEGGETQAPLGRAVVGGLASSTFITLFVVPAIYKIFYAKSA
ncbi:MAG: efflux RND transporter permease subunit [Deltaproteobacteria bacterium]|jgi:HAE1 family hydrophobic/amphiphilic exporter-1|nr:efflux RND transporter permease subunit [Deltaproteobacteria bacterium]